MWWPAGAVEGVCAVLALTKLVCFRDRHELHGNPTLPTETEACASVTSAFLQVIQPARNTGSEPMTLVVSPGA